jgi:DNA-binding transcriptional LysR family regulator
MFMDVDPNLMRVFDTLIELRSVTRAADRIGLTQSAVSHALGDPLFVRNARGLQPTRALRRWRPTCTRGCGGCAGALAPGELR